MKSKRRHQSSSDESEESEESVKSSSSSDSESEDSSASEHRHKKKKKHADTSDSESDSDDQNRSKKRKHKKKKKKHGKKKKRSRSVGSQSGEISLESEGEISSKKKRKHKHKHSRRDSEDVAEVHVERRLHSVVKERRDAPQESSQSRSYYQKEYRNEGGEEYEREREVQRFYRGSSKERRLQEQYNRDHGSRYLQYYQGNREEFGESSQYYKYENRQTHGHIDSYRRIPKYDDHRQHDEYIKRPKEETYHPKDDPRGYNRHSQYEPRGPKHSEYNNDGRDYRERRGPPQHDRYQNREYPEKKPLRYEERYHNEGGRDMRRERPGRPDRPQQSRDRDQSASPDDRYKRKPEPREERDDRYRDNREDRRDRNPRSEDRRPGKSEVKPRERRSRFGNSEDNKEYSWGKTEVKKEDDKEDKEKPNFGLSGKLTADANTVNGVVLKYTEPDDAKQPKRRWRFYPFKGDKALPILYIHRQSCFVIGRDKKVVDISLEHPSISKQHAALQYRATPFTRPDGSQGRRVRPYVIDLESANGTFVNNKKIDPRCYVELLERDVVKFGFSQREYVLLHENSKDDAQDDDNQDPVGVTTTDQIKVEKRVKQEIVEDGE